MAFKYFELKRQGAFLLPALRFFNTRFLLISDHDSYRKVKRSLLLIVKAADSLEIGADNIFKKLHEVGVFHECIRAAAKFF